MSRSEYYNDLKALARQKRAEHGVDTTRFGLREARKLYKEEGITIDYWPLPYKVKALYMCADEDFSVAIQKRLPDEPKLFALIHEYKHHLTDRDALGKGAILCGDYNANEEIEIGAEVFAAEFIYPENECNADFERHGVPNWKPEDLVRFKRVCKAKVSYTFLRKRLEWFGLIKPGGFVGIQFQKLEDQMFGKPFYRQSRHAAR